MKDVNLYLPKLALRLLFRGCDKGPDLTVNTQEGKNNFSCKVNEESVDTGGTGDWFGIAKAINRGFHRQNFNSVSFLRLIERC